MGIWLFLGALFVLKVLLIAYVLFSRQKHKKSAQKDIGIPKQLAEEFEEFERYCKEKGIDYKPMTPEEKKTLIDETLLRATEYWKRLRSLADLERGDVVRAAWFKYGRKIAWWEDDKVHNAIRGTWFEFLIPKMSQNNMIGVYTREDFDWGNVKDPARSEALFVVEEKAPQAKAERPSPPTTNDLVKIIARRLNDDGTYNPDGELLAIGDDLWGKTPTQVELLERKFKKMCALKKDDVFKADTRFVRGAKWENDEEVRIELDTIKDYAGNACDPTRTGALFVVESSEIQEDDHLTYIVWQWVEITARRLNDNGTYNPDGESIRFSVGDINWGGQVELAGQMHGNK